MRKIRDKTIAKLAAAAARSTKAKRRAPKLKARKPRRLGARFRPRSSLVLSELEMIGSSTQAAPEAQGPQGPFGRARQGGPEASSTQGEAPSSGSSQGDASQVHQEPQGSER
jgi:hypothetical protein